MSDPFTPASPAPADAWPDRLDFEAVRHARVLPLDIVQAKGNGHAGTAVSLTPALYVPVSYTHLTLPTNREV